MRKICLFLLMLTLAVGVNAQRKTDVLDRGLVAMKVSSGVYLSWRIPAEEYYDVTYNVYRNGTPIAEGLTVSNFTDPVGTKTNTYSVAPVVRGVVKDRCVDVSVWSSSYKEIPLTHADIRSTLVPNDACCADVDGDGELEIIMKFDNLSEMEQAYPKYGPTVGGVVTHEYTIFEVLKQNGQRLWWLNCGPNMGDFQNNEQNMVAFDWDQDGKAECVMRAASGTVVHYANGNTYVVGNANTNVRAATGGGVNWFVTTTEEYLLYMNGETGEVYDCIPYPLALLESGETDMNKAWGDGSGHRASKHFFGAPYLDGRKPSIFIARGIYTRHKMAALDVNPTTHKLSVRWKWYNNSNGPWKGQGYHNFGIADVDWDGRDEIVYGSMVIDDNGNGLSTTGLGHGDSQHCSDFNPYIHGQEIYACLEDNPGNNYRDATTSKLYHRYIAGTDDGRAMAGNFTNDFPGGLGCSAREGAVSTIVNEAVAGLGATGVNTNFRIYWDGDLCSETFNYLNGKNTEGCVAKYGSWTPIYTMAGSMTNNDTKGTPCYQGDILGDWREEVIMRTANNNIRIYSTPTPTAHRITSLWHDHQYRNAMVWQMCGYNQPPHTSFYIGEMEGITTPQPPLTTVGRTEVANGGTISAAYNDKHVIVCETKNSSVSIADGVSPYILTFNVPTWVQGSAASECTTKETNIKYTTYTCNVTGGGLAGSTRLVKQGDGILNLPAAEFTHTGETSLWGGVTNFNGTMKNSDLVLHRFAEFNATGEFKNISAEYASVIRPGGSNAKGTIATNHYSMGFGSRLTVDLFSNDITADQINAKSLSIETKSDAAWIAAGPQYLSPVIELVGHLKSGASKMEAGKYVIATIEGEVEGDVNSIILEGLPTEKKQLYVEDGKLILEILPMRDPATVYWTGVNGNAWDLDYTENFYLVNGEIQEPTTFVSDDDVVFDNNATRKAVELNANLMPASVTFNNSATYTLGGEGSIDGSAKFTKEGSGTVVVSNINTYTGGTYLKGGTTRVTQLANQYNEYGSLGARTTNANLFTMENGATLQTTSAVETNSPMKMVGDEGGVINNSAEFRMEAALSGTQLTKKGSGCLFIHGNSTLSRLIVTAGSVAETVRPATTVELQGGILYDDAQNTVHPIYVPEGKSAAWHLTYSYYTGYNNALTGSGTLTIVPRNSVSRVRIESGWNSFEGTIVHNTSLWLPLRGNVTAPKMTLQLAAGSAAASSPGYTYSIGAVTGSGSLTNSACDFNSSAQVSGNVTWNIGNSLDKDFTFSGSINDNSASNYCTFNKVGSCTMTYNGPGMNITHPVTVNGGLILNNETGANLGTGKLTLASGSTLTSTASTLKNSTIQANSTSKMYVTKCNFTGTTMTFSSGSELNLYKNSNVKDRGVLDAGSANITINNGAKISAYLKNNTLASSITTTGKVTINGNITIEYNSNSRTGVTPKQMPSWKIVDASNIVLGSTVTWTFAELPEGYVWDTSNFATDGTVSIIADPTGVNELKAVQLGSNELTEAHTLSGAYVGRPTKPGIYVQKGQKYIVE